MASKQLEKTNVVAGEERDENADVVTTQEEAGRPVNDTTERAADADVAPAGAEVEVDGQEAVQPEVHEEVAAEAEEVVADEAPVEEVAEDKVDVAADANAEEAVAADKPGDVVEPDAPADEKKADGATDLLKNVETLLTKLADNNAGTELKKVTDAIQKSVDEVAKSIDSLKDRVETLEKQPLPTKAQRFQVVSKGEEGEVDENAVVKALEKRQEEIIADPHSAKPGEAMAIALNLRKAYAAQNTKNN